MEQLKASQEAKSREAEDTAERLAGRLEAAGAELREALEHSTGLESDLATSRVLFLL